jgi:predicted O-methyltransferase YrrM
MLAQTPILQGSRGDVPVTQAIIDQIYRERTVTDGAGETHPLFPTSIDADEGTFLSEFVANRPEIARTLEVGCAWGLASLHITGATAGRPGAFHLMIDPYENSAWKGVGVANLERAGVDFFELCETSSELKLPSLVQANVEPFDLVFLDGFHDFDHTMVDAFYASRLIKVGGYIVLDDCDWRSVSRAVSYFSKLPCFKVVAGSKASNPLFQLRPLVGSILRPIAPLLPHWLYDYVYSMMRYPSMVALKKIAEDDRAITWYRSF